MTAIFSRCVGRVSFWYFLKKKYCAHTQSATSAAREGSFAFFVYRPPLGRLHVFVHNLWKFPPSTFFHLRKEKKNTHTKISLSKQVSCVANDEKNLWGWGHAPAWLVTRIRQDRTVSGNIFSRTRRKKRKGEIIFANGDMACNQNRWSIEEEEEKNDDN